VAAAEAARTPGRSWVSIRRPLSSSRKYSVKPPLTVGLTLRAGAESKRSSPPRPSKRCPEFRSIGSAIRWRAASGVGRGSGVCGA